MAVPLTVVEDIRRLDSQGVSGRDSVAKYTSIEDFSPTPPTMKRPGSKVLDGGEVIIDGWLEDDKKHPRKQRHTNRRVFDRLVAEYDYTGSYSPVQRYVKAWRQAHRQPGDGYIELTWAPGTAQVDFGQSEAIIDGERMNLHILRRSPTRTCASSKLTVGKLRNASAMGCAPSSNTSGVCPGS